MSVGLERVYERNSWANRLYLLLCFAFLFDFPGEEVGGSVLFPQNCGAPFSKEDTGYDLEFHNL